MVFKLFPREKLQIIIYNLDLSAFLPILDKILSSYLTIWIFLLAALSQDQFHHHGGIAIPKIHSNLNTTNQFLYSLIYNFLMCF